MVQTNEDPLPQKTRRPPWKRGTNVDVQSDYGRLESLPHMDWRGIAGLNFGIQVKSLRPPSSTWEKMAAVLAGCEKFGFGRSSDC